MPEAPKRYDITIIGGGPGGYVAAIRAAQLGARVCVYLHSKSAAQCGVEISGDVRIDFQRIMQRKNEIADDLVSGIIRLLRSHRIDTHNGKATILRPGLVRVKLSTPEGNGETRTRDIECGKIIIATGSVPARVPIPGTDLPGVLTSRELLEIDHLPHSLIVIGGSVVGIEFASIFNALGTQVQVLGRRTFLKSAEDRLAKRFKNILKRQGVGANIGLAFREITRADNGLLRVVYEQRDKESYAEGEVVLLSTGRWPYTEGLALNELGMSFNGRAIAVNEYLETSVAGIYAVGDCTGGYMLAHVASYEGEVAAENALGHRRVADYTAVPNCIFTMPEIAGVGLTEKQCKAQDIDYVVARFPFNVNGRALTMGEPDGQIRLICEKRADSKGGKVLGMHIMGPHASDLIAEGALAVRLGATAEDIANTIHAHPTLPEVVMEVAKGQLDGAIHYWKR